MQVTRELVEAIVKLRPYPSFQTIIAAIQQDELETMKELIDAPPDRVGRLQGRAKCTSDLLRIIDEAAVTLEKFQRNNPGEDGNARSTRISSTGRGAF
jgi:hypothetical protein